MYALVHVMRFLRKAGVDVFDAVYMTAMMMSDKFYITHAILCRCYRNQCFQHMTVDTAAFDKAHNGFCMFQSQVFTRSKISKYKYIKFRYVLVASMYDKIQFLLLIFGLFMLLF